MYPTSELEPVRVTVDAEGAEPPSPTKKDLALVSISGDPEIAVVFSV